MAKKLNLLLAHELKGSAVRGKEEAPSERISLRWTNAPVAAISTGTVFLLLSSEKIQEKKRGLFQRCGKSHQKHCRGHFDNQLGVRCLLSVLSVA